MNDTPDLRDIILVVDDTPENLKILGNLLDRQGHEVLIASSGLEALELIRTAPPHLILLDILMPGMDGYEVCRQLKADARLAAIPVIFISALEATEQIVQALRAGGVDYITKPFRQEEVLARIETHLQIARLRRELTAANEKLEARVAERTKALEESHARLRQSEKMELVGRLAGGIAHDFNNQLGGVLGYAEFLAESEHLCPEDRERAKRILTSAEHAAQIVRQLLVFSRKDDRRSAPLDLHGVIRNAADLLRHSLPRNIQTSLTLEADPSTIEGNDIDLQRMLLNLGTNARDAMPHGGEFQLSTRIAVIPGEEAAAYRLPLPPMPCLLLTARDTGSGMHPETLAHLFEPFFTTKAASQGTGLGLTSIYGVVQSHHGSLRVQSAIGQGTTFLIALPLASGGATSAPPPSSPA